MRWQVALLVLSASVGFHRGSESDGSWSLPSRHPGSSTGTKTISYSPSQRSSLPLTFVKQEVGEKEWSPCSVSCGGGTQVCSGCLDLSSGTNIRRCNLFPCADGIVDILSVVGLRSSGRTRPVDRDGAFTLLRRSSWRGPIPPRAGLDRVPWQFSLLGSLRLAAEGGHLLAMVREDSTVAFSILLAPSGGLRLVVPGGMPLHLPGPSPGTWNYLGLRAKGDSTLDLFLNCHLVRSITLPPQPTTPKALDSVVLGSPDPDSSLQSFKGDIEQLIISADPSLTERHCIAPRPLVSENSLSRFPPPPVLGNRIVTRVYNHSSRGEDIIRARSLYLKKMSKYPVSPKLVQARLKKLEKLTSGRRRLQLDPRMNEVLPHLSEMTTSTESPKDISVDKLDVVLTTERTFYKNFDHTLTTVSEPTSRQEDPVRITRLPLHEEAAPTTTPLTIDIDADTNETEVIFEESSGSGDQEDGEVEEGSGYFDDGVAWSECSVTCGWGSRRPLCREDPCPGAKIKSDPCFQGPCPPPPTTVPQPLTTPPIITHAAFVKGPQHCEPECLNGGTCLPPDTCLCASGYHGPSCQNATCIPRCLNGGSCHAPGECSCPQGYVGRFCEIVSCGTRCHNGGTCIKPGVCKCPPGFSPPSCTASCRPSCANGGQCVAPDLCRCPNGFYGRWCQLAVCLPACQNGGRCVRPNLCACSAGFAGKDCSQAVCEPPCENGGRCVRPDVCLCKPGVRGLRCDKPLCKCQHGGRCIKGSASKCICPPGYWGNLCENKTCLKPCLNGGRCTKAGKCECPINYTGFQCETLKCRFTVESKPYQRSYRRKEVITELVPCGPGPWKKCPHTKIRYNKVYKTFYRASYRCTPIEETSDNDDVNNFV